MLLWHFLEGFPSVSRNCIYIGFVLVLCSVTNEAESKQSPAKATTSSWLTAEDIRFKQPMWHRRPCLSRSPRHHTFSSLWCWPVSVRLDFVLRRCHMIGCLDILVFLINRTVGVCKNKWDNLTYKNTFNQKKHFYDKCVQKQFDTTVTISIQFQSKRKELHVSNLYINNNQSYSK